MVLPPRHAPKARIGSPQAPDPLLQRLDPHEAVGLAVVGAVQHAHHDALRRPPGLEDGLVERRPAREAAVEHAVVPVDQLRVGARRRGEGVEVEVREAREVEAQPVRERGGERRHRDEEVGPHVAAQGVDEAEGDGDGDPLFDVDVKAVEMVSLDEVE